MTTTSSGWPEEIDLAYEEAILETGIVREFAASYLQKPIQDLTFDEYCQVCERFGFSIKEIIDDLIQQGGKRRERWEKQSAQVRELAEYLIEATFDGPIVSELNREEEVKKLLHKSIDNGTIYSIIEHIGHLKKREVLTKSAQVAAKARLENDPKQQARQSVRECWTLWQEDPSRYKSKAAFARDMLEKYEALANPNVITRWCREWERESSTQRA